MLQGLSKKTLSLEWHCLTSGAGTLMDMPLARRDRRCGFHSVQLYKSYLQNVWFIHMCSESATSSNMLKPNINKAELTGHLVHKSLIFWI